MKIHIITTRLPAISTKQYLKCTGWEGEYTSTYKASMYLFIAGKIGIYSSFVFDTLSFGTYIPFSV